jgi:hypothetical protein
MKIIPDTPYDSGHSRKAWDGGRSIRVSTINDGSFSLYEKSDDDIVWTQLGRCGTFEKICEDFHRTRFENMYGQTLRFYRRGMEWL